MGLFDDIHGRECVLIKNELALDFEWVPKILPYREKQQRQVAFCISPLLEERNGKNLFIYGAPGIGKTAAMKHVLRELEEKTDKVVSFYINCWQKNTTFKIFVELCFQTGYKFTQNKKTEEIFDIFEKQINQNALVFVFDEIDKVEDLDFLYTLIEKIYKKSIILITNYKSWLANLDERIASRLLPGMLEFQEYNKDETRNILKQRISHALVSERIIELDALNNIVDKTFERKDIRCGIYLLRESALNAELENSNKILVSHAWGAIQKLDEFNIKKSEELDDDTQLILDMIKSMQSESKIGDLYKRYQTQNGRSSYKTFQRKIDFLSKNRFISTQKTSGGIEGNTTLISYNKQLTDY